MSRGTSVGSIKTLEEGMRMTGASDPPGEEQDIDAQIQVPRMHVIKHCHMF